MSGQQEESSNSGNELQTITYQEAKLMSPSKLRQEMSKRGMNTKGGKKKLLNRFRYYLGRGFPSTPKAEKTIIGKKRKLATSQTQNEPKADGQNVSPPAKKRKMNETEPMMIQKEEENEKKNELNSPFVRNTDDIEMKIPPKIIESESPFVRRAQTEEIESDEATVSPDFGGLGQIPQQNAPQIVELPSMSANHLEIENVATLSDLIKDRQQNETNNKQMMEIDDEDEFKNNSTNFGGDMLAKIVKNDEAKMGDNEDVPKLSQKMENVSVSEHEQDEIKPLSLDYEASENEKNKENTFKNDGFAQSVEYFT